MINDKKVIFSGIQPSGCITIGNYLGAVKNWVELQNDYLCCYSIVDLHALTSSPEPKLLRQRSMEFMATLLACGLSPEKNLIYFQSHVSAHSELAWILSCNSYMGELSRMTQFKDKTRNKQEISVNVGLFTYPILMAADILLYQTDLVPVGQDQKQHLELAQNIAKRFNGAYGDTFVVPEAYIPKVGAKIKSLSEPDKKMSKSDSNLNSFISITDEPNIIVNKIKRAVTDSENKVCTGVGKEGIENLINIYSAFEGISAKKIEQEFENLGYKEFKARVAEVIVEGLAPVRQEYQRLIADKAYLEGIYTQSAKTAGVIADKTLRKVCKKIGLTAKHYSGS